MRKTAIITNALKPLLERARYAKKAKNAQISKNGIMSKISASKVMINQIKIAKMESFCNLFIL